MVLKPKAYSGKYSAFLARYEECLQLYVSNKWDVLWGLSCFDSQEV